MGIPDRISETTKYVVIDLSARQADDSDSSSSGSKMNDEPPMPLYEYKCEIGHAFEEMQSFSDEPVATCGKCGASAKRQLSVPMVLYKGSGFYTTDYGRNGSASRSRSESNGEASASKSEKKETAKSGSSSSESSD